ncbi:MAG: hypothetical protein ACOYOD_05595 [Saprospiraceae bacterium]|jgi:hypothetical protein
MKTVWCIACAGAIALASGCERTPHAITPAFYHWKTSLQLSAEEERYLQHVQAGRLYVRFFDVDWDAGYGDAVPLAEVQIDTFTEPALEIIPAVFITNRTLEQLPTGQIPRLATRILKKITAIKSRFPANPIPEIQIDCDWTAGTRAAYFQLLQHIRKGTAAEGLRLSATVRLHQFNGYAQTGVPPVDRAMLMCYNTGDLEAWDEENSIYQESDARPYLDRPTEYPLPFDVALPAFRWGVLFRDGRLIRLIHGLDPSDLQRAAFRQTGPWRYVVEKSTYLDGYYLYQGDRIRLESTGLPDMQSAFGLVKPSLKPGMAFALSVYHLDTTLVQRISHGSMAHFFQKNR